MIAETDLVLLKTIYNRLVKILFEHILVLYGFLSKLDGMHEFLMDYITMHFNSKHQRGGGLYGDSSQK